MREAAYITKSLVLFRTAQHVNKEGRTCLASILGLIPRPANLIRVERYSEAEMRAKRAKKGKMTGSPLFLLAAETPRLLSRAPCCSEVTLCGY